MNLSMKQKKTHRPREQTCVCQGGSGVGEREIESLGFSSVQFSRSVVSEWHNMTLCDPMNRSTPGLPVRHHLPEFTHTHIQRVHDAIQPSHPGSPPSPPAPKLSQHQRLFQKSQLFAWGVQSTGASALASFLPKKSQGWSPSEWTGWISWQLL